MGRFKKMIKSDVMDTLAKPRPAKRGRKGTGTRPRRNRVPAPRVLETLAAEYGPFDHTPRYDPIAEVVFTILSQHTSDLNSERAFTNLMEHFGSFEEVARGDVELISQKVSIGGLARVKAPRIKEVLNLILEKRGGLDLSFLKDMPLDEAKEWLKSLPGIGPKTAAVILCFSLGMPAMAVDTHVYRVAKRLGLIGEKADFDQAHDLLERAVKPDQVFDFHMGLITHGRRVCKAQRPLCDVCPLADGCPSRGSFTKKPRAAGKGPDVTRSARIPHTPPIPPMNSMPDESV